MILSALLDPGQHIVHELAPDRKAWLRLVQGEATLGDIAMTAGDGAGIASKRSFSLTARGESEILLVDLGDCLVASCRTGSRPEREMRRWPSLSTASG